MNCGVYKKNNLVNVNKKAEKKEKKNKKTRAVASAHKNGDKGKEE